MDQKNINRGIVTLTEKIGELEQNLEFEKDNVVDAWNSYNRLEEKNGLLQKEYDSIIKQRDEAKSVLNEVIKINEKKDLEIKALKQAVEHLDKTLQETKKKLKLPVTYKAVAETRDKEIKRLKKVLEDEKKKIGITYEQFKELQKKHKETVFKFLEKKEVLFELLVKTLNDADSNQKIDRKALTKAFNEIKL